MKWKKKGVTLGTWYERFLDHQLAEVEFARVYADRFSHGTEGHYRLLLIAQMADALDEYQSTIQVFYSMREELKEFAANLDIELEQARERGDIFMAERIGAYRIKLAGITGTSIDVPLDRHPKV